MNTAVVARFDTQQEAPAALQVPASDGFAESRARIISCDSHLARSSTTTSPVESSAEAAADFLELGDPGDSCAAAVRRGGHVTEVDIQPSSRADVGRRRSNI